MTKLLTEKQLRLLKLADVSGAWFMPTADYGPVTGSLSRRGLIESRKGGSGGRKIMITSAGRKALFDYGVELTVTPQRAKGAELADYIVRDGGIFLRDYNVRLATFSVNTKVLQSRLADLFDRHHAKTLTAKSRGAKAP